jgi:ligand-binding sensor domain-containing protein
MKKVIISLLTMFFAFSLFSQEPEWTLYTSAERVNCQLIQDSLNWVGTDIGLVRYNLETSNYILLDSNNSGLSGNYIWSLSEQSDGTIWIGTKSGVSIFDGEGWNTYTIANSNLPHNWVPAIDFALDGTIWIGTGMGLVSIIDSVWTVYTAANSGLTNNYIRGLSIDENNVVWIATWGGGLVTFDGSNWTNVTGIPSNCITEVDIDNEGRKWVGTDYCGCICITDSTQIVYNTSNSGLPSDYVIDFAFDDYDGIWIGTSGAGVAYLLDDSWIIYNSSNSSLPGNLILSIAIENSGIVWVGGLYCFAYLDEDDWIEVLLSNSGLPCNNIYSLATYGSNNVWIGTQHGICNYDGFEWITYNINNSNLIGEKIKDIAIDSNGVVWVAVSAPIYPNVVHPYGVAFFLNNTWTSLHSDNSPLPNNNTTNITVDSSNRLWSVAGNFLVNIRFEDTDWICYDFQDYGMCSAISCYDSNILIIALRDIITLQFSLLIFDLETYTIINEFAYDNRVNDIKCDNNGLIWLATYSGLVRIDGDEIITFNTSNSSIPSNEINCIETETYAIWIGSDDAGLIKYNMISSYGNEWVNYNTNNSPLPSNDIRALAIDDDGTKWIGTDAGLIAMNETREVIQNNKDDMKKHKIIISNYPNPFNPTTTINYSIKEKSRVTLSIYNIKGQKVKTLISDQLPAGTHSAIWNGRDSNGKRVGSGIYFYKMKAGDFSKTKKMLLLK